MANFLWTAYLIEAFLCVLAAFVLAVIEDKPW